MRHAKIYDQLNELVLFRPEWALLCGLMANIIHKLPDEPEPPPLFEKEIMVNGDSVYLNSRGFSNESEFINAGWRWVKVREVR
jgi:hypothetical protein